MEDLQGKYKEMCEEKKVDLLPSVQRYITSMKDMKDEIELVIRGNDKFNFHERVTDDQLEVLRETLKDTAASITYIDLRYNHITDKGALALAEFLKIANNVEHIDLRGNEIGASGAIGLAEALKNSAKLSYLNLNGNCIGTDGCIAITELIFYNAQLRHLDLGNNDIKYDGIIALANVVGSNYSIEVLNMENPSFLFFMVGEEWAMHLGKMLANNIGLQKLSLRKHKLRCDGIYTIMTDMLENKKLRVLDLSANEIGVEGCDAIGTYLKQENCLMEALHLANNKCGDLGAKTMAQALAVNKSLCYFDFTYNNIHDDGLSRLGESLDINATLLKLKLFGHNYFGQEALDLFFKLQDKKPTGWVDFQVYIVDDHFDLGYVDTGISPTWCVSDQ